MVRGAWRRCLAAGLAASVCVGASGLAAGPAAARGADPSEASALSLLPVALVVAVPAGLLSGGAMLTVRSVEAAADGSVWVLERASDGARLSVKLAGGASVAVGAAVEVTALSTGWVLSTAGRVLCVVPNAVGQALLHHERVSR